MRAAHMHDFEGRGDVHASNNLFNCKTSGQEDGALKEDWGRELWKTTIGK